MAHHYLRVVRVSLAVALLPALLIGCAPNGQTSEPTPTSAPTAWPTLAPVLTSQASAEGDSRLPLAAPQLVDKFRAEIVDGVMDIYPLEGLADQPMRIEVIVLAGDLDPTIQINNQAGNQLAFANSGSAGEPEVIGQFQFPGDGYYELGIGAVDGSGQLGVSLYSLEPATIEGGGVFDSLDQELNGRLAQPSSYHIFQLPAERGTRFDIGASALTEGLDLAFDLYAPDGTLLEQRDDTIATDPYLWNFMPRQSGTYIIALRNFDEQTGDYSLKVSPSEGGGDALIGVRAEAELSDSPRRSIWYTLTGRSLDTLRIEARTLTQGIDLSLALYDQYGNRIIATDRGGVGDTETLSMVQLPYTGVYQVEFNALAGAGTIEYLIRLGREAESDLGGRIAPSHFARDGEMLEPGSLVSYLFDANAGDLVSVSARPSQREFPVDLGFDVYTPDGTLLASHDDDVGKDPVADRIELPQTGQYVVALWNFGESTGPFEIVIDSPEVPAAPPGEAPSN